MKLLGDKLKHRSRDAGLSVDDLAAAIERPGLTGDRAVSAIRNWMAGRDHPRCKASDVKRLASLIGCDVADIARFTSTVRHHRGSPRKARLIADLIRGKTLDDAQKILTFSKKRAAVNFRKALMAAAADAEQANADYDELVVTESRVDEGPHIKRFRPKDRGRAHPILKRTSHITIGVEER